MMKTPEDTLYDGYLSALLAGDRPECSRQVRDRLVRDDSVLSLYEEVIKESMYQVGTLWEHNKISVATEHMTSALTQAVMNELYERIRPDRPNGKKVLVACVEHEFHQIGIRMVADVFELNGWESIYLGADVPVEELVSFIRSHRVDVVALSLSIYFNLPSLENMLTHLRAEFPDLDILVGGQAFLHGGKELLQPHSKVYFAQDLKEVEEFIHQKNSGYEQK